MKQLPRHPLSRRYPFTDSYQIALAIILAITFNLSNCIKGGFAWLELKPDYVYADDTGYKILLSEACKQHIPFTVDKND